MEIDISALSFDELTQLEKQIKVKKNGMHNSREAFYKSDAVPSIQISDLCRRRFSQELYPDSKVHHFDNGEFTELHSKAYSKFHNLILGFCDLVIGNYIVKNDKIMFKGSIVSNHAKEYLALAKELGKLADEYDKMIFENGKEKE